MTAKTLQFSCAGVTT